MSFAPVLAAGVMALGAGGALPLALHAQTVDDGVIGEMLDLGPFPGSDTLTYSDAYAVSADGTVVVGDVRLTIAGARGFYWTSADGMREIDALTADGQGSSGAYGISADGRFVGGSADSSDPSYQHAYRLDLDTGTMVDVGTLRTSGPGRSYFVAISADGSAITGTSDTNDLNQRAYRWTAGGGIEDLGTLGGSRSDSKDISADGRAIAGSAVTSAGQWRAFRWVEGAGMQDLGTLTGAFTYGRAISADGSTVVGYDQGAVWQAFRWTQSGGMQALGSLASSGVDHSTPHDVNADGSVVVGRARTDSGQWHAFRWEGDDSVGVMADLGTLCTAAACSSTAEVVTPDGTVVAGSSDTGSGDYVAFRWTEDTGMESLGTLKADNTGESYVGDMSADGSVIVGGSYNDDDDFRAFIWRGAMQDLDNLLTSFPVLANDSAVAAAQAQQGLGQTMRQGFFAGAGQFGVQLHGGFSWTDRNPTTVGARRTNSGAVSLGYGVSDAVSVGVTASFAGTSLANNGFDMSAGPGLAAWARYSAGGAAGTGLQAEAAFGWSRAEGEITRGRLLANVDLATGSSSLETWGGTASVGYGMELGGWLVTPHAGLTHYQTTRAAYTETGASFNASYDEMQVSRTDLTLGVTGEIRVGAQGTLSFGAGIERALGGQDAVLSGTSDIPGMTTFNIPASFVANQTRGYVTAGYAHDFGNGMTLSGDLRVGHAVYGTSPEVRGGLALGFSF